MRVSKTLLVILIFLVLVLSFFWKTVFLGQVIIPADILQKWHPWVSLYPAVLPIHNTVTADIINTIYPNEILAKEGTKNLDFVLWNPYIFCGIPFLAIAHSGVLYPVLMVLRLFFNAACVNQISVMMHLFLMGIFMYLLMRNFGLSRFSSMISGIIWMFNGYSVVWLGFGYLAIGAALFPLLVLMLRKSIGGNNNYIFFSAIILSLLILAAFIIGYYVAFFLILFCAYYLFVSYSRKEYFLAKRLIIVTVSCCSIALFLSFIQLLPTREFLSFANRPARSLAQMFPNAFTKYLLLPTFFIPKLFGSPEYPGTFLFPGNLYNEFQGYMGILSLMLAVFAIFYSKKKDVAFFVFLSIFSLSLSLNSPLYNLFYKFIPLFNKLEPGRIIFLYAFSIAALSGFGMDSLLSGERLKNSGKLRKLNNFFGLLFIFTFVIFLLTSFFLSYKKEFIINFLNNQRITKLSPALIYENFSKNLNLFNPNIIIFFLVFGLSVFFIAQFIRMKLPAIRLKRIIFSFIILDLFTFGLNYNTFVSADMLYPKIKGLSLIEEDKSLFRVLSVNSPDLSQLVMPFSTKIPYKLQDASGYEVMYPRNYAEFMSLAENSSIASLKKPFGYHHILMTNYRSKLLNLLNIKYLITAPDDYIEDKRYALIYQDNSMRIYKNNEGLERVFIVPCAMSLDNKDSILEMLANEKFNPLKQVIIEGADFSFTCSDNIGNSFAKITRYSANRIDISAKMEVEGFLVLADSYYPGWSVFVNGKPDKIYKADYVLRAIHLKQGEHRIEFLYRPKSFIIGRNVSLATVLFIMLYFLFRRLRKSVSK